MLQEWSGQSYRLALPNAVNALIYQRLRALKISFKQGYSSARSGSLMERVGTEDYNFSSKERSYVSA